MSNNSNEPLDYECCDEHEVSYMGACGLCLTEEINEMLAEPKAISLVDKDFLKAVLSFIPAPATSSDASELASVPLLDWLDDGDRGEKGFTGYNLKFDEAFRIKDALSALPYTERVSISREDAAYAELALAERLDRQQRQGCAPHRTEKALKAFKTALEAANE